MGLFTNKKKDKPPHTWYPDILHWQEGDQIFCWNVISAFGMKNFGWADYHKYVDAISGSTKATFYFKSVDKNGNIFLKDEKGNLVQFEFWRFIKKVRNESLKSRQIEDQLKESEEYMELMKEFQKAFNDLQESDDHPHRLGSSSEQMNLSSGEEAGQKNRKSKSGSQ